ncbi:hypothetical protein ABTZ78_30460 [Streptomyces bauhiniae]|uniref:hypothetical protein n=1 Tax=Streptomyces bauhiniae TaxID=2340725 RepID=UPI0033271E1F
MTARCDPAWPGDGEHADPPGQAVRSFLGVRTDPLHTHADRVTPPDGPETS